MKKFLWLDDIRKNPSGYVWVKNYNEAIEALSSGTFEFASLDHDLAEEHYNNQIKEYREKTGYDVICWMEEHNIWPALGVRIHSFNPAGRERMLQVVQKVYGRTFQTNTPPCPWT